MKLFFVAILVLVTLSLQDKIDPEVYGWVDLHSGKANVMLEMTEQANYEELEAKVLNLDEITRGRIVFKTLTELAERTQKQTRKTLESRNIKYSNLWIQNTIAVYEINLETLQILSKSNDIQRIWLNGIVDTEIETPVTPIEFGTPKNIVPEWNVAHVNADKVWAKGFKGRGIVLATADTGTRFTHESLIRNYRGNKNGVINHNFNWYDPSGNSSTPVDQNGHGTHVMGTAAGGQAGRQIGMAPESSWISCRPFGSTGNPANFIKCLQFFLAPHDLSGRNANPDLRPHISSHSYVCRGCNMLNSIKALRAAGHLFVKSCGNSGPSCKSITEPGFYKEVICAGALGEKTDTIASFSSRGPSTDGVMKPDFSAPGTNVPSAVPTSDNSYRTMSGTSMAAPCLNGAIGLLWSAVPKLSRRIDETIEILKKSSKGQEATTCESSGSPNNVYGAGTIDIFKAYEMAKAIYGEN